MYYILKLRFNRVLVRCKRLLFACCEVGAASPHWRPPGLSARVAFKASEWFIMCFLWCNVWDRVGLSLALYGTCWSSSPSDLPDPAWLPEERR